MTDDFVTGMVLARRQASAANQQWADYAGGLQNQIGQLQQELQNEQVRRATNRADIAALQTVLRSLPANVQPLVSKALATYYTQAFMQRALELGLSHDWAVGSAETHLNLTRQKLGS